MTAFPRLLPLALAAAVGVAGAQSAVQVGEPTLDASASSSAVISRTAKARGDLPELGEPADLVLSPSEEARLRLDIRNELFSGEYLLEDPELQEYLNNVGFRVARAGNFVGEHFEFWPIKDRAINAFATPGGLVGVNAGLILHADSESEVASVLAHEVTHITQHHLARTADATSAANLATYLAMIGLLIAASQGGSSDAALGAVAIGQGMNYQRQVNYTRAHEQEADRIGIQLLQKAGYDVSAMGSFFAKLEQQTRLYGAGLPEFLRTHPVTTSRVSEARAYAEAVGKQTVTESPDFALMKARVEVLSEELASKALETFGRRLVKQDNIANRYGHALALFATHRPLDCLQALSKLPAEAQILTPIQVLRARALADSGNYDEADALLARLGNTQPRSSTIPLIRAELALAQGKADVARNVLLSADPKHPNPPAAHELLSQAAKVLGNVAETQYQAAQSRAARGQLRPAVFELQAALRLKDLNTQDRQRLLAYREEIIQQLPEGAAEELAREQRRRDKRE